MPAHEKVSIQQIVNALLKWRGNVQAAAEELGIRRNNLDERILGAGLDLNGFRKGGTGITPFTGNAPLPPSPYSGFGSRSSVQQSARGRNMRSMSSAAAAMEIRRRVVPRIRPDHLDKLSDAKYDLQAILRRDVTESEILEEFIEEGLGSWLNSKIDTLKKRARKTEAEK